MKAAFAGALFARPRRGASGWQAFTEWKPLPAEYAPDQSLDFALEALTCDDLLGLCLHWPETLGTQELSTRMAMASRALGYGSPFAASFRNPASEDASGLLMGHFCGMILGPDLGPAYANIAVAQDHVSEGIAGPVLLAHCAHEPTRMDWVRKLVKVATPNFRIYNALRRVLDGYMAGKAPEAILGEIPTAAMTRDPYDVAYNMGCLLLAVLASDGQPELAAQLSASLGGMTPQTSGVAASLCVGWGGEIPAGWLDAINKLSAGTTTLGVQLNQALDNAKTERPMVSTAFPNQESSSVAWHRSGDLLVRIDWLDTPVAFESSKSRTLTLNFHSLSDEEIVERPSIEAPDGWKVGHRMEPLRILPGSKTSFPMVIQHDGQPGRALLRLSGDEIPLPLIAPMKWYVVGPLSDPTQSGLDRTLKCEDVLDPSEVFMGRSDTPVKWTPKEFAGGRYDVEMFFKGSAGIVCLWSRMQLPAAGKYRLVAAASPGVAVTVNRMPVMKYRADVPAIGRPTGPYTADFETSTDMIDVLIKLERGLQPMAPLEFFLLDESGNVVHPTRCFGMER